MLRVRDGAVPDGLLKVADRGRENAEQLAELAQSNALAERVPSRHQARQSGLEREAEEVRFPGLQLQRGAAGTGGVQNAGSLRGNFHLLLAGNAEAEAAVKRRVRRPVLQRPALSAENQGRNEQAELIQLNVEKNNTFFI